MCSTCVVVSLHLQYKSCFPSLLLLIVWLYLSGASFQTLPVLTAEPDWDSGAPT